MARVVFHSGSGPGGGFTIAAADRFAVSRDDRLYLSVDGETGEGTVELKADDAAAIAVSILSWLPRVEGPKPELTDLQVIRATRAVENAIALARSLPY